MKNVERKIVFLEHFAVVMVDVNYVVNIRDVMIIQVNIFMQRRKKMSNELSIKIGDPQIIIPMQERACPSGFVFKLANGDIVVGGAMSGVDYPEDGQSVPLPPDQISRELSWRRSDDQGKTWHPTPPWPSYGVYQFEDGEIMCLSGRWWLIESGERWKYSVAQFRSFDNGYTFERKRIPIFGVPKLAKVKCQRSQWERYANVNHQIVKTKGGRYLASVQGKFIGDIKERVFIISSYNWCKAWDYLSTVAFDDDKEDKIRPLGFDEPNLLVLPNGDILCFMRTGSKKGNPLYMSRSKDNGLTWSQADPIDDLGVYPTACLMKNGVIAVVYGRPGDWIMFSADGGQTWINEICLNPEGPKANDCGGYDWVEEVVPDTLLVIYSRTSPDDCMISEIVGQYITVKPKS